MIGILVLKVGAAVDSHHLLHMRRAAVRWETHERVSAPLKAGQDTEGDHLSFGSALISPQSQARASIRLRIPSSS